MEPIITNVKTQLSVADFVIAGACLDGVLAFAAEHELQTITIPVDKLLKIGVQWNWINKTSGRDGYGYGYGHGDGDGDGYGYGHGDGFGYGYGFGHGDGDGDGYGYGDGDGFGDGISN